VTNFHFIVKKLVKFKWVHNNEEIM
jgi:hypothetical protein